MKGIVTNIQRYSLNDGAGIRTVVFLKGCPLRCRWCSNPETINRKPQMVFHKQKCISCGSCQEKSEEKTDLVTYVQEHGVIPAGLDEAACPTGALELIGKSMSSDEVLQVVQRDRQFYNQDGGLTLSGGEALVQWKFASEVAKKAQEDYHIHVALETTGFADWKHLDEVTQYCDEILFDVKQLDEDTHKWGTNVSNRRIIENLRKLALIRRDKIRIRVPLIAGFNADDTNIAGLCRLGKETGIKEIHLLPYHKFGEPKYAKMGWTYDFNGKTPDDKEIQRIQAYLTENGFTVRIGG